MKDGVYTHFTNRCVKCGGLISAPYMLPVEENAPLCDDCEKREPKKEEPKPSPIGVPF